MNFSINDMVSNHVRQAIPNLLIDETGWVYKIKDEFIHSEDYPDSEEIKDCFGALVHFTKVLVELQEGKGPAPSESKDPSDVYVYSSKELLKENSKGIRVHKFKQER